MQKARLAEQAERYDDMAAAMKSVSPLNKNRLGIVVMMQMTVALSSLRKDASRFKASPRVNLMLVRCLAPKK